MKDGLFRVVSVSGGKDSTALYLWAMNEFGKDGFRAVFADTGHEHPVTLNYVRNIHLMTGGPEVEWVKADFSDKLKAKLSPEAKIRSAGVRKCIEHNRADLEANSFTLGSPFLDMMIWKGKAPSTKAQFCTEFLKLHPIRKWLIENRGDEAPIMYVGIRAGESARRAKMPERELNEFMDCMTVRPLIRWSEQDVFDYLAKHGVEPNPLYKAEYSRVGCFPCIHARKSELAKLPDWAWDKLEDWEKRVGRSWFAYGTVPLTAEQAVEVAALPKVRRFLQDDLGWILETDPLALADWKNKNVNSVSDVRLWAKTSRGGSQFDFFAEDEKDVPACMSTWGACE